MLLVISTPVRAAALRSPYLYEAYPCCAIQSRIPNNIKPAGVKM